MKTKQTTKSSSERSPIALIRAIKEGELAASSLAGPARRSCVEHLHAEGWGAVEIAELLSVSVRTIRRDIAELREEHNATSDPKFVARMVGMLMQEGEVARMRLRRLGRDKDSMPADRIAAERAAWEVVRDLVRTLQGLGFLPSAVTQVQAELTHRMKGDELLSELREIETITKDIELADTPGLDARLGAIRRRLVPQVATAPDGKGSPTKDVDASTRGATS